MKTIQYTVLLLFALLLGSCEEVIDVDLGTAAPRLVIDASIIWQKGTDGTEQKIRLTTTTGYFENSVPLVSGATVYVTDSSDHVFTFVEDPGTGNYLCTDFIAALGEQYMLTVLHDGQTYTATETLKAVPVIDKIEQETRTGFGGEFIQVKAFYTDNASTDDFYLFRFSPSHKTLSDYQVSEDEFYQGNQIFGVYLSEDLEAGDNIDITINGISQRYYNYMTKIIAAAGSGGPFQSPGGTIRGNIVNTTEESNYALGYFRLSETDNRIYTIE